MIELPEDGGAGVHLPARRRTDDRFILALRERAVKFSSLLVSPNPQGNGFVEPMNRTLLDECLRVTGRTIWYAEPEEIPRDLDRFLAYDNLERSHQGYRLKRCTPAQALRVALGIEELPPIVPEEEATEPAA